MKKLKTIFVFGLLLLSLISCKKNDSVNDYQYKIPELADDGWEVGSTNDAGINSAILTEMMNYVNNTPDHNIHNILIFKDEKLIFEEYFEGYLYSANPPGSNGEFISYNKETDHYLASVSKTITSVIFGAAVKEGFIDNLNDKVVDIFPEYNDILSDAKADITLKHLLTMSSGLAWDESSTSYENPTNDVVALFNSDDPIAYTLSRTLLYSPGTQFLYNSGGTNVLGAVVEKATGMSLLDFGNDYLFDPLNIEGGSWQRLPSGYFFASGGIYLRPRELAKIGYLFLHNGYWGDVQIVTEDWIAESVDDHIETHGRTLPTATGYGYQWWLQDFHTGGHTYECFFAAGWGEQYMFVFPELEMIVVFNGGNYLSGGSISIFSLLENYILESL
ncbi:serine hydrolase domain-containing protein [Bacteroidota bacterium]